ncbi:hypothetical protein PHYBLDRAFT_140209 [Phycomyces blakesleeanus NRRL 1555(-)]|uniref:Uncharacterized protein n=1 Tax=Phycomyces blakesleeanus (strain ATCC 8743b / DSM 1359 / FGSC 10004 / NBRC 33097 / NRRL 1555) TaxID=763407 RepID=A0A162YEJ5_PHYB8|nr:hypothetical protein PHYBLDRAFT_140209 [Phycomyces blakesleeanus NRRL 1555(-)]OAD80205.1 hypothetical protein PHYBLDRAFT_140209 [Phycomyces blakesleeanus NRRL 1555(-)]|eukprot:XP_018298245.1 hypothetical protein PHYBLDRAFT_140209 [Phycomyces blakesleeanus NRRL 1555(-)]
MDINVTYSAYDMMDINDKASVNDSIDFDGFLAAATNNIEADEEDASLIEAKSSNIEFVPMYTPNSSAEAVSLELFSLFFKNSVSHEIYNQSVKIVDILLKQEYTVKAQVYDMCASGCFHFPDVKPGNSIVENEVCPHCNGPWYQSERGTISPVQTYQVVPLSEQLHFKLAHPKEQAKIAYGTEDILDGDGIHRLLAGGIVGQSDMVVSMFVDQFNPFKDAAISASIIHVINMNINPAERYKKGNMTQLAIIPGPKHPKNIASFLEPILADL